MPASRSTRCLSGPSVDSTAAAGPAPGKAGRGILAATGIAAALLASVLTWVAVGRPGPGPLELARLARLTPPTGRADWPSWSPDGSLLAFSSDRSGNFEIYVRRGEGGQDVDDHERSGPGHPARLLARRRLDRVRLDAGLEDRPRQDRRIALALRPDLRRRPLDRAVSGGRGAAPGPGRELSRVAPDGRAVYYVTGHENRRAILEVPAEGGTPHTILSGDQSLWEIVRIAGSPDGRWISFESQLEEVFVMPVAGGKPRMLFRGFSHAWGASPSVLWALSRDASGGARVEQYDFAPDTGAVRGRRANRGLS